MIPLEFQIVFAVALDLVIGDPKCYPHPVTLIAKFAMLVEKITCKIFGRGYFAGIWTVLVVVAGVAFATSGLVFYAGKISPALSDIASILIMYTCFAAHDLARHSRWVYDALCTGDLELARKKVSMIVGRDTHVLDETGVSRAAIESVAENLIDGVTAPLIFAIAAGPVGVMTYKAINTLDSTFGYKTERMIKFGWASARLDDVANLIPARLTLPMISLAAFVCRFRPIRAFVIGWRDRKLHSSPNSAWGEAAVAGALGIQLSGPTCYKGVWSNYPTLGDKISDLKPAHILQSNKLMLATMFATLAIGLAIRIAILQNHSELLKGLGL